MPALPDNVHFATSSRNYQIIKPTLDNGLNRKETQPLTSWQADKIRFFDEVAYNRPVELSHDIHPQPSPHIIS
jgi:hypothetical protein